MTNNSYRSSFLVTHPHDFDKGEIRKHLIDFLKFLQANNIDHYYISANSEDLNPEKDAIYRKVYGKNLDSFVRLNAGDESLDRLGRAPLNQRDARALAYNKDLVFLAGGYLTECLASTYKSLIEAAKAEKSNIHIHLVSDLIYAKYNAQKEVKTLDFLLNHDKQAAKKALQKGFPETKYVSRGIRKTTELESPIKAGRFSS